MNDTWYDMGLDADMDWMYNWKGKEKENTKVAGMTQQQLIEVAEKLNKWIDNISNEYQIDKIDLQGIIKQFLIG